MHTEGMTVDEQVGERVHQAMWRQRLQQSEVAPAMGITQSTLSRKIRGQRAWSVEDLYSIAAVLKVDPATLLPDPNEVRELSAPPTPNSKDVPAESWWTLRPRRPFGVPAVTLPMLLADAA